MQKRTTYIIEQLKCKDFNLPKVKLRISNFVVFCALLLLIVPLAVYSQKDSIPKTIELVSVNQTVPYFEFNVDSGKVMNITDFRGKVVYVNFFATWCSPCMAEMPRIQKEIWEKYKNNVQFAMMVIGREHSQKEIMKFKRKHPEYNMPFFADADRNIYSKFATGIIPRSYILDKDGIIVYSSNGYTPVEFENILKQLSKMLQ